MLQPVRTARRSMVAALALASCFAAPVAAQPLVVRLPPPSSEAAPVYQSFGPPPAHFNDLPLRSASPVDRLQYAPPPQPQWYPTPPVTAASPIYSPYTPPFAPQSVIPPPGYEAALASAAEPALDVQDGPDAPGASASNVPKGAKDGVLQQVRFSGAYLARGGGLRAFGMDDLELRSSLAFPFFTRESPLILSPGFGVHYLDGPEIVELPPSVYDAYLDIRWLRQLTPRIGMDLSVAPGVYSDFNSHTDNIFRLTGRGLGAFEWTPTSKIVLGVAYVNRGDVNWLPVAGLVWTPHEAMRYELIAPQPRIARRFGQPDPCSGAEWWGYLGGEFGGGRWAFTETDGDSDRFTYNDLRLLIGIERRNDVGSSLRFEAGWVFWRTLELDSVGSEIDLTETVLVRGVAAY